MSRSYKPDGYTSVAPYLVVDGASRLIDFLVQVFGAERLRMVPGEAGRLRHGEVRIDDTVVMIADALPGWPALESHLHVYVADVDATFGRALAAGAESVQAPMKKDDPDRRGGFKGPGGVTWWVATQTEP
ncbi:MAG: VOC family protein [Lautropia sp.]